MPSNGEATGVIHLRKLPSRSLCLVYPHTGTVRQCFMASVMGFREFDGANCNILGAVMHEQGMYIAAQRNALVKGFLKTPYKWWLTIDSDQKFDPQIPHLLIQSAEDAGAKVMSALYFGIIAGRYSPMWWTRRDGVYATVSEIVPGIQEIGGCGTGMLLVHRSVFEEMAMRYVDDSWKWFAHDVTTYKGVPEHFGEDLCFCDRLHDMGVKIYGDSRLAIGHEKIVNVDFKMFLEMYKIQQADPDFAKDRELVGLGG